jgi:MIP family channel proteins
MHTTAQKLTAEFLGSFALVFFGAGAVCADQFLHGGSTVGLLGIALASGLAFAIMSVAVGGISGAHFNPAITISFWVTKRMNTLEVVSYWVAQFAGAVAAAFLLKAIIPEDTWRAVALGTPELVRDFPRLAAMVLEAAATFFLVFVLFATRSGDPEATADLPLSAFSTGLTITLGTLVAGPFTGAALNPARHFGPALASAHWANWGVYWVGPLAGGFLAGLLHESFFLKKP